jgi:hypothetical protein
VVQLLQVSTTQSLIQLALSTPWQPSRLSYFTLCRPTMVKDDLPCLECSSYFTLFCPCLRCLSPTSLSKQPSWEFYLVMKIETNTFREQFGNTEITNAIFEYILILQSGFPLREKSLNYRQKLVHKAP